MMDPPDISPGSSPWDTNRTNRTRSSVGKYESALFLVPVVKCIRRSTCDSDVIIGFNLFWNTCDVSCFVTFIECT